MAKTQFIRQVIDYMYPAKNRVIASVAFVRTFKQTFTGTFTVGGTGLVAITANDISTVDWTMVGWTAVALLLSSILSGAVAFDDVSRNGLNSKYMDAANAPAPAVQIDPAALATVAKQLTKPAGMIPAPAVAPVTTTEAPKNVAAAKPARKRAAVKKVETPELKGGIAQMAPAVELPL